MILPKGSDTFISDYQTCPSRCFHKHIARDAPYVETASLKWGNDVHKAMEDRITGGKPLTKDFVKFERFAKPFEGRKTHGELRLGVRRDRSTCGFYDADAFFGGKVDTFIVSPDDTSAVIFDWKTGKVREEDFQLRSQALLIKSRFPKLVNLTGCYVWLNQMQLGIMHDLSDIERTWAEICSIMATIEQYAAVNHWPKREGPLCAYCPVMSCEFNRTK